jgi:hypothetical protein
LEYAWLDDDKVGIAYLSIGVCTDPASLFPSPRQWVKIFSFLGVKQVGFET